MIWKILVAVMCSIYFYSTGEIAQASDCEKARELYAAGTRLLNYEERAKVFQEAINLCPAFAEAHVNLADAYENLAKLNRHDVKKFNEFLDKAVQEYQEALNYNNKLFAAFLGIADTYRVIGLYGKSEQAYEEAFRLKPGNFKAKSGLEKIRAIYAQERDGFKKSDDIIRHFKVSSKDSGPGALMGFEDQTVVKDRLLFHNILFDEWSAELRRGEAVEQLREIGKALSSSDLGGCDFVVEGHTDPRGGIERNEKLSWDRAESVRKYLIEHYSIEASRIKTQGFGYSRPRYPNDTQENMLRNRRVELLFVDKTGEQ